MAIGASGTIQAINKVISAAGWSTEGITLTALKKLVDVLAQVEHVDKLKLDGLNPSRAPIFPGGVMILLSVFEALKVDRMEISDGALREGLLYDLLGRIHHEDVRSRSVTALAARYHIDQEQAKRVSDTARYCLNQIAIAWEIEGEETELLLNWAAELHEIGLDIAHSHYHKHGAYVVEHADLYGFSRQEQKMISTLIRVHRRKFPETVFKTLPQDLVQPIQRLAILVRLGVLLHRSRSEEPLPLFTIQARKKEIDLEFPDGWLDQHALTQADLEQEAIYLLGAGFTLTYC